MDRMKPSPKKITRLLPNQIFVFGSNLSGIHGKGAARLAFKSFDAEWGAAEGLTGQCYALPTKKANVRDSLSLKEIENRIQQFLDTARINPHLEFLVTEIGCGYAGYKPAEIKPLWQKFDLPRNVRLPQSFI